MTLLSIAGGLITLEDLELGQINHALTIAVPGPRAEVYAAPVHRTDGFSTNPLSLPEGAHPRLDPNLDLASLHLPRLTLMPAGSGAALRDRPQGHGRERRLLRPGPDPDGHEPIHRRARVLRRQNACGTPRGVPLEPARAAEDGTAQQTLKQAALGRGAVERGAVFWVASARGEREVEVPAPREAGLHRRRGRPLAENEETPRALMGGRGWAFGAHPRGPGGPPRVARAERPCSASGARSRAGRASSAPRHLRRRPRASRCWDGYGARFRPAASRCRDGCGIWFRPSIVPLQVAGSPGWRPTS